MSERVTVPEGPVEYEDSGSGKPMVLIHGTHMNGSLWQQVVDHLGPEHRCVVPTLPMGLTSP